MMTTRAMPEGTMKVSRKSVTIRPSNILGYVIPIRSMMK